MPRVAKEPARREPAERRGGGGKSEIGAGAKLSTDVMSASAAASSSSRDSLSARVLAWEGAEERWRQGLVSVASTFTSWAWGGIASVPSHLG
jgi:hypothetical protein